MERKNKSARDGGDSRRGKRKSNPSLHPLYSADNSTTSSSSTKERPSRQRVNAPATTSALEQDKTVTAQPSGSTSGANTISSLGLPPQSSPPSIIQQRGISTQSPAFLPFASTSNLLAAPTLDDVDVAPPSYDAPMIMLQPTLSSSSFNAAPSFPYPATLPRTFDTDNPLYPFPTFRQTPSGQGGVQEPQIFGSGYQPGYSSVGSEPLRSIGPRRSWLQQTQQQQQQQQSHLGNLGTESPFPQQSLHPSHSATVSDQQRPSSAFAAPPFSSGVGGGNVGHETSSMMGMTDASFASSQTNFDGQQNQYQDTSGHVQGSIGPVSLQRTNEYRPEGSDPSSLGSSEWSSLPNLRLLRGVQGDLVSSNSSVSQLSAPSERGKRKQSRAHLQRHLRSLQNEMVALKEKVRVAEGLYRETSPDEQSTSDASSGRLYDTTFGRKPMDRFEMRDYRGNDRTTAQSSNEAMVESSGSAYSSSFSGHPPATNWKQHPYTGNPSQTASSTSSAGALPPRRGTWKTGAGNVLVFNTAAASDTEQSSSALTRAASYSEQNVTDEGDEDEDEDEDTAMRGPGSDDTGKRYQCLVPGCLKSFTTSGHARRHSRTHLGHKLFVCPHDGCDSTFTRRDNCRQHQRARHHMTLPVPELSEGESLENLILDRQQASGGQRASSSSHQISQKANTTV